MIESNLNIGGGVVFWTPAEYTSRDLFAEGLKNAGFEKFAPEPRLPTAALQDALQQVLGGPRVLIRRLKDKDGFNVVEEVLGKERNDYRHILMCKINEQLQITFLPYQRETADKVLTAFNNHIGLIRAHQVSKTLVDILQLHGGVRLRPSGSVYWLPDYQLPTWQSVALAAEQAGQGIGNRVYLLRHRMDADAMRAVQDAITHEVLTESASIDREVAEDELGSRALEHRQNTAMALRKKVLQYEEILGQGLSHLLTAVERTENAAARAAMLLATQDQAAVA